jgi:hypothetical protein
MQLALPTQLFLHVFMFRVVFELLFYEICGRRGSEKDGRG